ncbi:UDP-2,3-diacylglucosamine diphosphatase [Candidatus Rariloculus sp.]|uniref:UDP-2,3-diacylglucosamine diphosphatase n=1 Tax=Candidatus Rariloculus sp. TaxID=3101265 RepID=UPI003D098624
MAVLFISDLHLESARPEGVERFVDFVGHDGLAAQRLYILGDLFEAWVGDDDTDPGLRPVAAALGRLTRSGVACFIMHGNRDFLIGERFAAETGCTLLGDYETVEVHGRSVLLTHGDLLCTDDEAYMTLREIVRDPAWQAAFLAKPLAERHRIADGLRQMSRTEIAAKPDDIMDINQSTVERTMRRFGVNLLLHGHTHRPAVHEFPLDADTAVRIVLGAWHERASVVRWDEDGFELVEF